MSNNNLTKSLPVSIKLEPVDLTFSSRSYIPNSFNLYK